MPILLTALDPETHAVTQTELTVADVVERYGPASQAERDGLYFQASSSKFYEVRRDLDALARGSAKKDPQAKGEHAWLTCPPARRGDLKAEIEKFYASNAVALIQAMSDLQVRGTLRHNADRAMIEALAAEYRQLSDMARAALAENSMTPASVLKEMAGDGNERVRWAVASNMATPDDALLVLARQACRQEQILDAFAFRAENPPEVLDVFISNIGRLLSSKQTDPELLWADERLKKVTLKLAMIFQRASADRREALLKKLTSSKAPAAAPMVITKLPSAGVRILGELTRDDCAVTAAQAQVMLDLLARGEHGDPRFVAVPHVAPVTNEHVLHRRATAAARRDRQRAAG